MFKFSPGALGAVSRKPLLSASEKWASGRPLWVRGGAGRNEGPVSHVGTGPIGPQGKPLRSRGSMSLSFPVLGAPPTSICGAAGSEVTHGVAFHEYSHAWLPFSFPLHWRRLNPEPGPLDC